MFARWLGRGSTSETTDLSGPKRLKVDARKVNESLYELKRPSSTPEMELLFFHGLQSEDESDAHLRTWESEDGSSLWPQSWLAEEFPAARILCVAYDGSVRNSSRSSFDMHNIVENLMTDFMQGKIGQTPNCPVALVGHCFGGLVIKQLCLEANSRKQVGWESQRAKVGAFLDNVKGVFFYGTPHHGIPGLGEASELVKNSQLLSFFETLSNGASRLDFEFTQLRQIYATWLVRSLGEDLPVDRGILRRVVAAPEGTPRTEDDFNLLEVDHRSICKPKDKNDKRFYFLTELLDMIAREWQAVLPIHELHELPTFPLDLERRALVVKEKLIRGGILGMCGMGGIGKTTLAKQTFNMISNDFEYTCFVDNVKGIPSYELQNWVLNQFHHNGKKSVHGSTQWFDLRFKKALIVMDDVDKENQLRALPKLDHFGVGSCIIITSRNTQVFKYYERCIVHEVDLLEQHDAKRLICQHAFGTLDVPEFLTDKVDAVVRKCDGLPLTLEVIGKYLQDHSTDVEVWTETLHRLTIAQAITGEQDEKVWASLRISYDDLLPEEKEIFTVAALFFFEKPLDDALAAWSTATQTMRIGWRNLVNRSLVKEINKRVWVHEHLRDLAHNISKEFMLSGTDEEANAAVDLLNDKQVQATTKCLRLKYSYDFSMTRRTLQMGSLAKLKGLKYMDLEGVHSEGSGTGFTTKISYLRFHSFNMSEFEFSLNKMENLAVMDLSDFRIRDEFLDALGTLTNLCVLHLSKLEGFDHLPENLVNLSRLRRLEVMNLRSLTLPKSFGNLRALKHLALERISSLVLPESLWYLSKLISTQWTGLQSLSILSKELDTLPDSLCGLKFLRELKIQSHKLKKLPESLGDLSFLKTFWCECLHMEKLPDTFGNLRALEELFLVLPLLERLPEGLGGLHCLRKLDLREARKLKVLPENFGGLVALQDLRIGGSEELQTLPDSFSGLKSLQLLALFCATLERLPENFGNLSALRELSISSRSMASLPESIRQLHSLKKLSLEAEKNTRIPLDGSGLMASLHQIQLDCDGHEQNPDLFDSFRCFSHELTLTGWRTRILPAGLGGLLSLRALTLIFLPRLETLPDELGTLSSLERLTIKECDELKSLPDSLGQLSSLERLTIEDCEELKSLPDSLGQLSSLKMSHLSGARDWRLCQKAGESRAGLRRQRQKGTKGRSGGRKERSPPTQSK